MNRPFILAAAAEIAASDTDPLCWPDMRPDQFDTTAKPQPLTLFAAPDPCGTPDMFANDEDQPDHREDGAQTMYERTYGPKYHDLGEYPTAAEIARAVRADIKAADKAGELPPYPAGVKFAVTCENYAGGCAVNVNVYNVPDDWAWTEIPEGLRRWPTETKRISDELGALAKTLGAIREAYNHDGSDIQTDYFDVRYYGSVFLGPHRGGGLALA